MFFNARYYDPMIRRFVSPDTIIPDPANPQDFNRYSYVRNNPVNFNDPTGHCIKASRSGTYLIDDDPTNSHTHANTRFCTSGDGDRSFKAATGQDAPQSVDVTARDIAETASATMVGPVADAGDIGLCATASGGQILIDCGLAVVPIASTFAIKQLAKRGTGFLRRLFGRGDDVIEAACSFSGETEVVMADGTTKPLSRVEVGDWVLAHDPATGERGARQVTHVWIHDDVLVDLGVDGEYLTTTVDHPFWNVTDESWQRADTLDAGDLLLTADGGTVRVDGIDWSTSRTDTAYNLTINDIHTYHVTVGTEGVLVHNVCWRLSPPAPDTASKGVHLRIDGVELAARPGHEGTIVFTPVFSNTKSKSASSAIKQAQDALAGDSRFKKQLLDNARRSLEFLQTNPELPGSRGRQAEIHFLIKALEG